MSLEMPVISGLSAEIDEPSKYICTYYPIKDGYFVIKIYQRKSSYYYATIEFTVMYGYDMMVRTETYCNIEQCVKEAIWQMQKVKDVLILTKEKIKTSSYSKENAAWDGMIVADSDIDVLEEESP